VGGVLAALGVFLLYLLFWPIPFDPAATTLPAPPPLSGVYAPNTRLAAVERLPLGDASGPEDIAFDSQGRIYSGVADGRILRLDPDGRNPQTFADAGGRPLGLRFDALGSLIVANAYRGLLSVSPTGEVTTLATGLEGAPFKLVDAVAVAPDGTLYFTDATRFPNDQYFFDLLEHRPNGHLLAYDPRTRTTRSVLDGLYFANGVAISPDGSFLLVNEMSACRVRRYWLSGPRQGQSEVLVDNLPGFPDNIASNGRGTYWVGLARGPATRGATDLFLPYPILRRAAFLLHLGAPSDRYAWILGLDAEGHVVQNLQDPEGRSYANITAAVEREGVLYLGSVEERTIGRLPLDP
jgi:sugar lactone lactonase YvrE